MLRFFENRNLRSIGDALGTTEEAARKRVTRALENGSGSGGGDRTGALAALQDLPDGWARSMGPWVAFNALGKIDPAGALHLIETLPAGSERNQYVANVLSGWAESDP